MYSHIATVNRVSFCVKASIVVQQY